MKKAKKKKKSDGSSWRSSPLFKAFIAFGIIWAVLDFGWMMYNAANGISSYSDLARNADEMIHALDDMTTALDSIVDQSTIAPGADRMKKAAHRMVVAMERALPMKARESDVKKLEAVYGPKFTAAKGRGMAARQRIESIPAQRRPSWDARRRYRPSSRRIPRRPGNR